MVLKKKKIKGNLSDIAKDLISKFDANQKNDRTHKDVDKSQDKKDNIFTINRPCKRSEPY